MSNQAKTIISYFVKVKKNKIADYTKVAVVSLYEDDEFTHLMPGN